MLVAFIVVLLVASNMTGKKATSQTEQSFTSPTLANEIDTMVVVPAAVQSLSDAAISKAGRDLRAVAGIEGASGEMIYSQNCYDSVTRAFDWMTLDKCGTFDLLSVRAIDSAAEVPANEATYFASEAVAGRYLAAVMKAGETPEKADLRLDDLQKRASRLFDSKLKAVFPGSTQAGAPASDENISAGSPDAPAEDG